MATTTVQLTLEKILSHPILMDAYEAYLVRMVAQETILFVRALTVLRTHETVIAPDQIVELVARFVTPGGEMEMNVTSKCRKKVMEEVNKVETWGRAELDRVFAEIEQEVLVLLVSPLLGGEGCSEALWASSIPN
jgi:hypothetical protein